MATRTNRIGTGASGRSRTSLPAFIATSGVLLAVLFALGLGRDNFWPGVGAGILAVALVAAATYAASRLLAPRSPRM